MNLTLFGVAAPLQHVVETCMSHSYFGRRLRDSPSANAGRFIRSGQVSRKELRNLQRAVSARLGASADFCERSKKYKNNNLFLFEGPGIDSRGRHCVKAPKRFSDREKRFFAHFGSRIAFWHKTNLAVRHFFRSFRTLQSVLASCSATLLIPAAALVQTRAKKTNFASRDSDLEKRSGVISAAVHSRDRQLGSCS